MEQRFIFKIKNGKIRWEGDIKSFFDIITSDEKWNDKVGEVIIRSVSRDTATWAMHKYYRGFLVPAIAQQSFDGDIYIAHIEMKKKFLFQQCQSIREIPKKYIGRCMIISHRFMDENGELHEELDGYIPSTGDIPRAEFAKFIVKVEAFSFNDIGISVPEEAIQYRSLAQEEIKKVI